MSVFHSESAFNCSNLDKSKPFVQMPRMDVCRHDRIELYNPESCEPGLRNATVELVSRDFVKRVERLVAQYGDSADAAKKLVELIGG